MNTQGSGNGVLRGLLLSTTSRIAWFGGTLLASDRSSAQNLAFGSNSVLLVGAEERGDLCEPSSQGLTSKISLISHARCLRFWMLEAQRSGLRE